MSFTSNQLYLCLPGYIKHCRHVFAVSAPAIEVVATAGPLAPTQVKPMLDNAFVQDVPMLLATHFPGFKAVCEWMPKLNQAV